jgi:hypothetical protein
MDEKKWFFRTIAMTVAVLATMAMLMVYIDPYFHYHGPVDGRTYALYSSGTYERYYNDGIGKHFQYDAMITGSSVTENFQASQLEALWGVTAVKTCFAGGSLKDVDEHIQRSLAANDGVSMVVRGIDENKLLSNKEAASENVPYYLYDNNLLNDVNYLFNKDTWLVPFKRNIEFMLKNKKRTDFDEYSNWTIKATFSKEHALSSYERPDEAMPAQELTDEALANIQGNIEQNIVATVRSHPGVTFYYFLTPTSILQWDEWIRNGVLEQELLAQQLLLESLLQCDNVRVFGFSDDFSLITNLDNYQDIEHFSDEINSWILDEIYAGEHELTTDNYLDYINKLRTFYGSYDYDGIFQ